MKKKGDSVQIKGGEGFGEWIDSLVEVASLDYRWQAAWRGLQTLALAYGYDKPMQIVAGTAKNPRKSNGVQIKGGEGFGEWIDGLGKAVSLKTRRSVVVRGLKTLSAAHGYDKPMPD